ncbi:MAG: putative rane protein [Clostridiales bacterium]|jgi:CDP-diacylglycerol--glycerol-3-phosphate 3-phosphatidyltransferase|nr:putative rane protein [Clostridiales bacterium]
MNIANRLTLIRVLLIPLFLVFMLIDFWDYNNYIAFVIFAVASYTDYLDGHLARKHNLVTNFGKFMDPLADKLLVGAALIGFVELGIVPAWIVIITISREFIISGFRLVAASQGLVMAAGWWGKVKTAVQMTMILVLLLWMNFHTYDIVILEYFDTLLKYVGIITMYASVALAIISATEYIVKNLNVLKEGSK